MRPPWEWEEFTGSWGSRLRVVAPPPRTLRLRSGQAASGVPRILLEAPEGAAAYEEIVLAGFAGGSQGEVGFAGPEVADFAAHGQFPPDINVKAQAALQGEVPTDRALEVTEVGHRHGRVRVAELRRKSGDWRAECRRLKSAE